MGEEGGGASVYSRERQGRLSAAATAANSGGNSSSPRAGYGESWKKKCRQKHPARSTCHSDAARCAGLMVFFNTSGQIRPRRVTSSPHPKRGRDMQEKEKREKRLLLLIVISRGKEREKMEEWGEEEECFSLSLSHSLPLESPKKYNKDSRTQINACPTNNALLKSSY